MCIMSHAGVFIKTKPLYIVVFVWYDIYVTCKCLSYHMQVYFIKSKQIRCTPSSLHDNDKYITYIQVSLFLRKFQLTPEEVDALSAELEPDEGKRFFSALLRLKAVRASCGRLVGSSPQSAGWERERRREKRQHNRWHHPAVYRIDFYIHDMYVSQGARRGKNTSALERKKRHTSWKIILRCIIQYICVCVSVSRCKMRK